jgi:hypothetical protein
MSAAVEVSRNVRFESLADMATSSRNVVSWGPRATINLSFFDRVETEKTKPTVN